MPIRHRVTSIVVIVMLAGCATGKDQQADSRHANASPQYRDSREGRKAVLALKKDGVDASNFVYWRPMVTNGCENLRIFPLPQEDFGLAAQQLEKEFGPIRSAFKPFFVAANASSGPATELPLDSTWETFALGFENFKINMQMSRSSTGGSPLREVFIAMLGGSLGQSSRWQLWYADRFSRGLTIQSFLRSGRESEQMMHDHWAEADSGRYMEGATRKIFGKSWQPKGWTTGNERALTALNEFISALAHNSGEPDKRASRAVAVLAEFKRELSLSGMWSQPNACDPLVREGLQLIETPEDYQRNDKEVDEKPQGQRPGKKQGSHMRGVGD